MWEQKNESPHHPATTTPYLELQPPHLRPHRCSLLPGPHIRGAQYVQTLIRISLRSRQGKEREMRGWEEEGFKERRRRASVPDQAELPAPDYDTIFSAGFPASSCFCEYGA